MKKAPRGAPFHCTLRGAERVPSETTQFSGTFLPSL